jgi:hypothetical protein
MLDDLPVCSFSLFLPTKGFMSGKTWMSPLDGTACKGLSQARRGHRYAETEPWFTSQKGIRRDNSQLACGWQIDNGVISTCHPHAS